MASLGHLVLGLIGIVGGAATVSRGMGHLKRGLKKKQMRARPELGRVAPPPVSKRRVPGGRRVDDAGISKRKLRVRLHDVKSLDDRMRLIRQKIQQGKLEPEVIEWARKAVTKKCGNGWCIPEKDTMGEAKAIFEALRRDVRYTSDVLGADTYARASQTLRMHAGDCDDYTITGCSALNAIGIPCAADVIQTKGSDDWNHIYAMVGLPRVNPTRWVPFDASIDRPFGWEAPKAVVARRRRFRF